MVQNPFMAKHRVAPVAAKPTPRWGQERRLELIDFRLRWDGRLNRADLIAFFGISVPQASLDIARYTELAPTNLQYDRSARVYLATEEFRPLYPSSSPSRFFNEVLATASGVLPEEASLLGWRPPIAVVPVPGREVEPGRLKMLLRAVRERRGLRVLYQSLSRAEPAWRELSPHAFAHDGFRWHVRAYCHERQDFLDFVIPRMLEAKEAELVGPDPEQDTEWHTEVELVLTPNPKLPLAHQRAIAMDYGMTDGSTRLRCRRALLFYVLQHLGLLQDDTPEAKQVVLRNTKEVEKLVRSRHQSSESGAQ